MSITSMMIIRVFVCAPDSPNPHIIKKGAKDCAHDLLPSPYFAPMFVLSGAPDHQGGEEDPLQEPFRCTPAKAN